MIFQVGSNSFVGFTELVITSSFGWDIWLTFHTAFYDENLNLVTNSRRIVLRYIMGWFWIDLLSIVPFEELMVLGSGGNSTATLRISRYYVVFD